MASVYYLNSIDIVAKSAELLGYEPEAREYRALYEKVLEALRAEYITPAGRLLSDTQTGLAMGLQFGICREEDRPRFLERLCKNLESHKNHLTTGFAGTRVLCRALSENGRHDLAGKVFLKEDCPGWLYHVKLGGTTVWELWDGVNPDGSFNKFEMNSLNQYAYASIGEWMYKDLCGLRALEPGYRRSLVRPRLIEGVTELSGGIETVYGRLGCKVICRDRRYEIDVEIPANTTTLVDLPGQEPKELGSGSYHFEYATEEDFVRHKYNKETVFGDLLKHPVGSALLKQYAPELLGNDLFMTFAARKTIEEISAMLPPGGHATDGAGADSVQRSRGERRIIKGGKTMQKQTWNGNWSLLKPGANPMMALFMGGAGADPVALPHDAMIHEERVETCKNGHQTGFYPGGCYTYTKSFFAPEDWREKTVQIEFEGVYQNARVMINGDYAGGTLSATGSSPSVPTTFSGMARRTPSPWSRTTPLRKTAAGTPAVGFTGM